MHVEVLSEMQSRSYIHVHEHAHPRRNVSVHDSSLDSVFSTCYSSPPSSSLIQRICPRIYPESLLLVA